jgi:hypothetical protein
MGVGAVNKPNLLLQLTAVVSSLLLAGGLVAYRAGAFTWVVCSNTEPQAPAIIGGSKSKVLLDPIPSDAPGAKPPTATQATPDLMYSSKSFGPVIRSSEVGLEPPLLAPPVNPEIINVPPK